MADNIIRRTTRLDIAPSQYLLYIFDLIRNNVARRARVDRLRCHDEAWLG